MQIVQQAYRILHGFEVGDADPGQHFGLGKVRGDEGGEGEQSSGERCDGGGLQQSRAAGRDHHGVHDQWRLACPGEEGGDCADGFRGVEHSGFYGLGRQFFEDGLELLADDARGGGLDGEDAAGILGGEAGDGAGAVDAEGGEDLQVRLDAGAAAAVGAGDGQGDGGVFDCGHSQTGWNSTAKTHKGNQILTANERQ